MALFSNTLAVIRQSLSSVVGDLINGTFDSGTTTTGVHVMLLKGDDYYNHHGYRAYIYAGANIGEEREVDDWVLSSNTLTLAPAFTAAIDNTSEYELHYIFTEDDYRKSINQAIEFIADDYLLDDVDITTTLATDTYEYAMPTSPEFQYVHRITKETVAAGGVFEDVNIINPDWYRFIIVSSASYIKFNEIDYKLPSGDNLKDIRIEGQKRQAILTADTDTCYLPLDWLIRKAITFLPNNKIQSNKLDRTLEIAIALAANIPLKRPYPKSKRVLL